MKKQIAIIGILILLGTLILCDFNPTMATPPSRVEYDVTITLNYSLQLFFNQSTHETVSSINYDNNHNEKSRIIHGVCYETWRPCYVKNNGLANLTNVSIVSDEELIEIIAVLEVNETFSINLSELRYSNSGSEILNEQGVYAKIYLVAPKSEGQHIFEFNGFSISFMLFALIPIILGVFYSIQYKRKKKKSYISIIIIMIILTIICLLLSYFSGSAMISA